MASPAADADLATTAAVRDAALAALAGLCRAVRTWMLRALVGNDLAASGEQAATVVDAFLRTLGLPGLPAVATSW